MNPFKNQIVNLSSSDVIKNKKTKHIYSAVKKDFQYCKEIGKTSLPCYIVFPGQ